MANVNGMQANMGLSGVYTAPQGIATPSPADTSLRLSMEAAQRQQESQQVMSRAPLGAPQAFQQQFQQQMYQIQAQQSMNPYAAQALSHSQPGGAQQYLPSPLTMTPVSSGVFRPPPQRPSMAPIAPTYTPSMSSPMFQPFTPQAPTPMFGSSYDQRIRQQDIRANQDYAMYSQAPSALGYGAGIMAGAGAGAVAGRSFGAWGALAGAGIGAIGAGMSGLAGGVGDLAQGFMRPSMQRHQMGAGLQNMSQNWVTTGGDVSALGRGLSRDASLNLAGQVQDLAGSSSFQKQTGGMFNSQDLMQITRQGGAAGLFDMAQDVPKIKQKLQETAGTIKQFMELTNDASVTSVIRQMGRLQQFGLNQQEMVTAAQGMRSYARAAGTTIEGLQQIGGLPGAATFQGAGLTAGQGFQYGNFAAGTANQMVASGALSQRQLALQGGVQGMAQRNMQSQAAFASMPMFAASQAQFSGGSWGVNPATAGRGDGAFGMVQGSMQSMNQAVQQGGIGALALFQMKQKELADTTLSGMTPMEQMAQKMKMAMSTGTQLGMTGRQALAVGGSVAFDTATANQMDQMASSPQFWETKRQAIRQRQLQLGAETAERNRTGSSILGDAGKALGFTGTGSWGRKTAGAFGDFGESFGMVGGAISGAVSKGWNEHLIGTDVITNRFDAGTSGIRAAALKGDRSAFTRQAGRLGGMSGSIGGIDVDQDLLLQAAKSEGQTGVATGEAIGNVLGTVVAPGDVGTMASGAMTALTTPLSTQREMAQRELVGASTFLNRMERSKLEGGSQKKYKQAYSAIESAMGSKGKGMGIDAVRRAGKLLDKRVQSGAEGELTGAAAGAAAGAIFGPLGAAIGAGVGYLSGGSSVRPSEAEYREILVSSMVGSTTAGGEPMSRKDAEAAFDKMSPEDKENLKVQVTASARENSADKAVYDALEGDVRKNRADQIESATNQRIAALKDDTYTRIEDALDLDPIFGMYTSGDKKIQDLAAEYGDEFGAMALTAASLAGAGDTDVIAGELQAIDTDQQAALERKIKGMSEEERKRLADVGATGVSMKDISSYGATTQATQAQTAFGSAGFMKSFGKYSKKLGAHLGTADVKAISGKSVAGQFTKDEIAKMSKFGGTEGRRMAKLVERAQYTGPDEKRKQQAMEAQGQITEMATLKSTQDEEGVDTQAKVAGEGKEARDLEKDMAAIDEMAAMFADFKPSIKEFAKGTSDLAAAMESDAITRILEND